MEPRTLAGRRRPRPDGQDAEARPPRVHLTAADLTDPARARSALAAASLAACVVGLVGAETGVFLVVAGVWTIRSLAGERPGAAWGIACIGAAVRWGALGLVDVEVATRLAGPSVASGIPAVRIGLSVAFAAALCSEAASDAFRRTLVDRAAAAAAVALLVPLFLLKGGASGGLSVAVTWVAAAGVICAAEMLLAPYARRVPTWAPVVASLGGVAVALVAR